ncbi:MAG: polymer-forming cytoskeletal protein [Haloferacaceae archaeon]
MKRFLVALLVLCSLAALPATAAAEQRVGGSVVVEPGERVDGFTATAGTVVVRGTVDGDLQAYAGTVVVAEGGEVTGTLQAYAGTVRVGGRVGGRVRAYGGDVVLAESGSVGGSLAAGAGSVTIAGTVGGDVTAAGDSVTLASTARVRGDVTYDGSLTTQQGAQVSGTTRRIEDLQVGPSGPALPPGAFVLFGVLANFVLGAVLLVAFPAFARDVVDTVTLDPLWAALSGVAAMLVVPLFLAALAVTVVGVPTAVAGLALSLVLAWVAAVYGQFAAGVWLVSFTDYESRWLALAVGLLVVGVLGRVPYLGPVVQFAVVLLGLGAVVRNARERYDRSGGRGSGGL